MKKTKTEMTRSEIKKPNSGKLKSPKSLNVQNKAIKIKPW